MKIQEIMNTYKRGVDFYLSRHVRKCIPKDETCEVRPEGEGGLSSKQEGWTRVECGQVHSKCEIWGRRAHLPGLNWPSLNFTPQLQWAKLLRTRSPHHLASGALLSPKWNKWWLLQTEVHQPASLSHHQLVCLPARSIAHAPCSGLTSSRKHPWLP